MGPFGTSRLTERPRAPGQTPSANRGHLARAWTELWRTVRSGFPLITVVVTLTAGCLLYTSLRGDMVHERGGYYLCSGGGNWGPPPPWAYNTAIEKCVDEHRRVGYVDAANVKLGVFLDWPAVVGVLEGTPAAKVGIKDGDRLRELDGTPLPTFADFVRVLRDRRPGDRLAVGLERQGQSLTTTLVLDPRRGNEEDCVECGDQCVIPEPQRSPFLPCRRYLH
jgi:hypothetical protein